VAYGRQRCRTQNTASVSLPNLSPIVKLGGIAGFHNKAAGLGRVTLGAFAGGMVSCAFVRFPLFAKRSWSFLRPLEAPRLRSRHEL
jgi:hypothetical protein